MNNPLNELSAVYNQNIAEGCGCDEKKKEVKIMPQGDTPNGGSGARLGKNKKSYVEPMGESAVPGKPAEKLGAVTAIPKDEREAAKERLLAKAKAKRVAKLKEQEEVGKIGGGNLKKLATKATKRVDADVDGDVDTDDMKSSEMGEYVPSPNGKKLKTKVRFESYSNWREDLIEVVDPADANDMVKSSPKTDTQAQKEIKEKKVNNKIKINPPQGVTEGFGELGGVVLEMYELSEKIDLKKADMGEVIKDFRKSDAPQFKGKSKEKKREMAIAAKLEADRGNVTEADMTGAPSIKDAKPVKKINVKYDPKMKVMAPQINKEETEEEEKKKRELQAKTKEHDDKMAGKKVVEETGAEYHARMKKKVMPWKKPNTTMSNTTPEVRAKMAAKKTPTKKPTDTRTDAQKMADATGPRPGSRYRGD